MKCYHCGRLPKKKESNQLEEMEASLGTGYGMRNINGEERHICYECCAQFDKADMQKDGRITLYLTQTKSTTHLKYQVTNWPGTLIFNVQEYRESKTNWGHDRVDVWFRFAGYWWWGKNIGNHELTHCKRTKRKC